MIKAILSDLSYVLLSPKDPSYTESLNGLYSQHKDDLNFKFFDYFQINTQLLEYYQSLKPDLPLYMLTSQQIQKDLNLSKKLTPIFTQIFSAEDMNVHKKESKAYQLVATKINLSPSNILFIDDSTTNLDAAKQAGLQTLQFESNQTTIPKLQKLFSKLQSNPNSSE